MLGQPGSSAILLLGEESCCNAQCRPDLEHELGVRLHLQEPELMKSFVDSDQLCPRRAIQKHLQHEDENRHRGHRRLNPERTDVRGLASNLFQVTKVSLCFHSSPPGECHPCVPQLARMGEYWNFKHSTINTKAGLFILPQFLNVVNI